MSSLRHEDTGFGSRGSGSCTTWGCGASTGPPPGTHAPSSASPGQGFARGHGEVSGRLWDIGDGIQHRKKIIICIAGCGGINFWSACGLLVSARQENAVSSPRQFARSRLDPPLLSRIVTKGPGPSPTSSTTSPTRCGLICWLSFFLG